MTLKMEEAEWEAVLNWHIEVYATAMAPEQSELNPVGITTHTAERFAKKHNWKLELNPVYIGGGVYLRVFHFTPADKPQLDESIKRINVEEEKEGK